MTLNIIKIGGNIIDDELKLQLFIKNYAQLDGHKILIHGGGKIATKTAEKLGINSEMIEGRRVTSSQMRDVATMVYGGLINKNIVGLLQKVGINALGLSGADAKVITAHKRPVKSIDYGFVGDIDGVNAEFLAQLLKMNISPVLTPLSFSETHGLLNTNADTIASETAKALAQIFDVNLVYCFEKKGVLSDSEDDNSVIPQINYDYFQELKSEGKIFAGMIPKLDNAFEALKFGVKKVVICQAEELVSAVLNNGAGTVMV